MTEIYNIEGTPEVAEDNQATTVQFRGQTVRLRYTLLSLQRLESTGVKLSDLETLGEDLSITVLGKVLWAGLCVQFNDATLEEVLNSFELSDLQDVSNALSTALSGSVGK